MVSEKDCIFCRILRGEIPSKKVFEDSESFAFLDINPRNPGHTLVIPKRHRETLLDMDEEDAGVLFMNVRKVAGKVMAATKAQGISVSQSNGAAAGQIVSHVHFHIIPRFANEGPPGLETMLSSKRMDEKALDSIAAGIRNAEGIEPDEGLSQEKPVPARPSPAQRPVPAAAKPKPKDDLGDDVMDEEIDEDMFNFK